MKSRLALAVSLAVCSLAANAQSESAPTTVVASVESKSQHAIDQYKHQVANRIVEANKLRLTKAGYRNITVVGYTLDRRGALTETWIVRSSGDRKLDDLAHASFKKASPLPMPPGGVFGPDLTASLSEAFVHTTDGSYRLQTLVK